MHVVHVSAYFAPAFCYGGPARSVFSLCRALQRHGLDTSVVTTTGNGNEELMSGHRDYGGVPVSYCRRDFPRRFFRSRELSDELARSLSGGLPAVAHLHGMWNWSIWSAAAICRARGVPYVLSPRGMLNAAALAHHRLRKRVSYRFLDASVLQGAAAVHATSPDEKRTLETRTTRPVFLIPNGVDGASDYGVSSVRADLGIPKTDSLFVFVGRLHPMKRLDLLVAAFRELAGERQDCWLVLAGPEDGVVADDLLRSADRSRLRWVGSLDEDAKWALLSEADALVLCSDSESFGLSVAEAQSAGCPVVVTKTCPWELVETYRSGLWVEQNPSSIAQAMSRLASDPRAAREMGERGRKLVQEHFDWKTIAKRMSDVYGEVCNA